MKIAFVSTRGIPNNYGGFEQFAEYISVGLVERGHEVTVYSPHYHPYRGNEYKGVRIKHIYSPEQWMGGSIGSFFYDYSCLKDALRREDFDIIYEAGYTSIVPAYIRFNVKAIKKPVFTTNMDGLEYKRTKFNPLVRKFVFWEEKMAVKHSHYLIADNMGIHDYYQEKYGKESTFLAYGADIHDDWDESLLQEYGLRANQYYLVVARLEPENNLVMAIEGYLKSNENGKRPLVKPIRRMVKNWPENMGWKTRFVSLAASMISKSWTLYAIFPILIFMVIVWAVLIRHCLKLWLLDVSCWLMITSSIVLY